MKYAPGLEVASVMHGSLRFAVHQQEIAMKWLSVKPAVVAAAFITMGFAAPASADATLVVGDANYLGLIVDGVPGNLEDELRYINNLLGLGLGATNVVI